MKKERLTIVLDEYYETCGDGCCTTYGTVTTVNGVELPCHNQDAYTMISQLLEHLKYELDITYNYNKDRVL